MSATKKSADEYIGALSEKLEAAYRQYEVGNVEDGKKLTIELLDLIHKHLHLPSKRDLKELSTSNKHLDDQD